MDESMFIERTLSNLLQSVSTMFPVVLLTGPRQVGKTTLLKHCVSAKANYVTLDSLVDRELAKNDPALFLQRYDTPLIIDEIQYAPELFSYIKIVVDEQQANGLFWLTGSQQFHLMHHITESLAGRVGILKLLGLSQAELMHQAHSSRAFLPTITWDTKKQVASLTLKTLYHTIWRGSFPAMQAKPDLLQDVFYSSYLQTYIQRDIRQLAQVADEHAFLSFVRAAAVRTGQLLNLSALARDVGIDNKTAKHWLSLLETSGLIYLLPPYANNLTKRLVKTPKLYFLDTGLCCYLARWTSPQALEAGAMSGAILETFVVSDIIKSYWHHGRSGVFYFYRDKDQNEIDVIIDENGTLYPIEIKKTAMPSERNIKSFDALTKLGQPIGQGALICLIEKPMPVNRNVNAIPVNYI